MDDILTSIIGIALAVIIMFIFPLITMTDITDDISQLTVEVATTEFVDEIRQTGKITPERYAQFIENIGSTGNTYSIEMEVKILDENIGKKSAWTQGTVIGENVYYSVYTSQIVEVLNESGIYNMKEGDIFSCSIKNTNKTLSQTIRGVFYSISTGDTYSIAAQHSGVCTANGSK